MEGDQVFQWWQENKKQEVGKKGNTCGGSIEGKVDVSPSCWPALKRQRSNLCEVSSIESESEPGFSEQQPYVLSRIVASLT